MKKTILLITAIFLGMVMFTGCKSPKPVKTIENLKAAIKGETTASAKYAAFAQKALEEGFELVAKLFEAASKAEQIHAGNHAKVLEQLGEKMEEIKPEFVLNSTKENLEEAIKGETYEEETMYPGFIKAAQDEKAEDAVKSFTWAMDTEKKHAEFYKATLDALATANLAALPAGYMVCPKCGNTYGIDKVADNCDFCMTPKDQFIKI